MSDIFEANLGEMRLGRLNVQFKLDDESQSCKVVASGVVDDNPVALSGEFTFEEFSGIVLEANRAAEILFISKFPDVSGKVVLAPVRDNDPRPYREGDWEDNKGEDDDQS